MDERLRQLERLAVNGDPQAAQRLEAARHALGLCGECGVRPYWEPGVVFRLYRGGHGSSAIQACGLCWVRRRGVVTTTDVLLMAARGQSKWELQDLLDGGDYTFKLGPAHIVSWGRRHFHPYQSQTLCGVGVCTEKYIFGRASFTLAECKSCLRVFRALTQRQLLLLFLWGCLWK